MNRLHLFELEDQSWFPDVIRKGLTDYLQFAANRIDLYRQLLPIIKKGMEKSGSNHIIDLCAGGGGGIHKVYSNLKKENIDAKITLTDKFPNIEAYKELEKQTRHDISFVAEPVDAMAVPKNLDGFRTMFVSFHHFRPQAAKNILQNVVDNNSVIGIFEATERSLINFIAMIFGPIVVMLAVPFIRPFKWNRLFFTYIIPLIPLAVMWDGMVSVLRTYSIKEMKGLISQLKAAENYTWEFGRIKVKGGPAVLYTLGYPKK